MRGTGTKELPDRVARHKGAAFLNEEKAAKYAREMAPDVDERLWKVRSQLVLAYMSNPAVWPNGPDGRAWGCEAWFKPEEWRIEGEGDDRRAVRTVKPTANAEPETANALAQSEPEQAAAANAPGEDDDPAERRREYMRKLMRDKRAKEKAEREGKAS